MRKLEKEKMTDKISIGDRIKRYESVPRTYLTPRMPTIIRVDGKAFSSFTKGFGKPWDLVIRNCMTAAAVGLMDNVQGAELAYIQSDEISILLNDYKRFESQAWFQKNVQKMASVSASIATAYFGKAYHEATKTWKPELANKVALFDSRVFVVPREEATNALIWRQQDAIRNSVSGLAQAHFSHRDLHGKNVRKMKEMLKRKGIRWEDCDTWQKHGWCVVKQASAPLNRTTVGPDWEIPNFSKTREYIEQHLGQIEE